MIKYNKTELSAEDMKELLSMLDKSKDKHKTFMRTMNRYRRLVEGAQWKDVKVNDLEMKETKLVANLINSNVRSLLPTLFFKNPSLNALPTHPKYANRGKIWSNIINNTNDKIGFKKAIKSVILDGIIYSEGWLKWVLNKQETPQTEINNQGPSEWLSKDSPIPVRVSPLQVITDYAAVNREPENQRFIVIRYLKPIHDILNDDKYTIPTEHRLKLQKPFRENTDVYIGEDSYLDLEDGSTPKNLNEEFVYIYEWWVHHISGLKIYQKTFVTMEGLETTPIRQMSSWDNDNIMGKYFNEYPLTGLFLNPVPDAKSLSEVGVVERLQVPINWLLSRLFTLVKHDKQIYEYDEGAVADPKIVERDFHSGETQILVKKNTGNPAFNVTQPSFQGRDNYTLLNTFLALLQQVSGLSTNRRGGAGIRTATEADIVEASAQVKTDEKVDTIKDFLSEVIRKEIKLIRSIVALDGQEFVIRVLGDSGDVDWQFFTPEDIDWLPDIEIDADSFRKRDSNEYAQNLMLGWQTGMQLISTGVPVRLDILYTKILERLKIDNPYEIINNESEQMIKQTVELMQMIIGQDAPVDPADSHTVHSRVIDMFRNSEAFANLDAGTQEAVMQHQQEHMQAIEAMSAQGKNANQYSSGMFDGLGQQQNAAAPTPQSEARVNVAPDSIALRGR